MTIAGKIYKKGFRTDGEIALCPTLRLGDLVVKDTPVAHPNSATLALNEK